MRYDAYDTKFNQCVECESKPACRIFINVHSSRHVCQQCFDMLEYAEVKNETKYLRKPAKQNEGCSKIVLGAMIITLASVLFILVLERMV